MLDEFVPNFSDHIFEGYNARLPEEANAYKNMDAYLKNAGFSRRSMPTASPRDRRFLYWKGGKRIIVVAHYAGKEISVDIPGIRTEARLAQTVLPDFISGHVEPYVNGITA